MAKAENRWQRYNDVLEPKSPRDWPRFLLLAVLLLAVVVVVQTMFGLVRGDAFGSGALRFGSIGILIYLWVGGTWWRTMFQFLNARRRDSVEEESARRLQRIGSVIWIVLAYVVCFIELVDVSSDSTADDDSGTSVIGLIIVLLLPIGLAWLTAVFGRYMASRVPPRPR